MALSGPGWVIIHPRGLVHATIAQCSFWHDLRSCREDRLAVCLLEQKIGDWLQLRVLEAVAPFPHKFLWLSGFKNHTGALWAKPARGVVLALFVCSMVLACLFLAGSWISITATGAEVAGACTCSYRCHTKTPGWGRLTGISALLLLLAQAICPGSLYHN